MARGINKISIAALERLRTPGRYADGGGLYLVIGPSGAKSWALMVMRNGKRRELGLGSLLAVSLEAARAKAAAIRADIARGLDPTTARDQQQREAMPGITFQQVAEQYLAAHSGKWRNEKHRGQWASTLQNYAYPTLGNRAVASIDVQDVLKVLQHDGLWNRAQETASRLRARIEAVLGFAKVHGYRTGDNPAVWRGNIAEVLPVKRGVQQAAHFAAMPWADVPTFLTTLGQQGGTAAVAMRFTILTAARTNEALGAKWEEIDLDAAVWTVPAIRTKTGREHRVPLSGAAVDLLRAVQRRAGNDHVFVGLKPGGGPLAAGDADRPPAYACGLHGPRFPLQLPRLGRRQHELPARSNRTSTRAHQRNTVEAAYLRTDHFDKRRMLMEAWAAHCTGAGAGAANVVPLRTVEAA